MQNRPFSGEVEVDESFFGARHVKGKRGRGAYRITIVFGNFQCTVTFILKLFQTAQKPRYKRLSVARSNLKLSSILASGVAIRISSMLVTANTCALIVAKMSLPKVTLTSIGLKVSGDIPRLAWFDSVA